MDSYCPIWSPPESPCLCRMFFTSLFIKVDYRSWPLIWVLNLVSMVSQRQASHCTCCTKAMSRPMGPGQPSIDAESPAIHGVQHVTVGQVSGFPTNTFPPPWPYPRLAFWAPRDRVGGHNQTKTWMTKDTILLKSLFKRNIYLNINISKETNVFIKTLIAMTVTSCAAI